MNKPTLRDITYIYEGEFYIVHTKKGIEGIRGKIYDTKEILSGEDSLPGEYLDNEITVYPWDSDSVVVIIRDRES